MKRIIIMALLIFIGITIFKVNLLNLNFERNADQEEKSVQIANPASVYCEENSGKLEIRKGETGETGICLFEDGSECEEWSYMKKECFSKTEEEFNASGRAKAYDTGDADLNNAGQLKYIEDEGGNWNIYNNPEVGFSIQYPSDSILINESNRKDSDKKYIKISAKDMQIKEGPMDLSPEEEMTTVQELSGGNFGLNHDFVLAESKKVKSVGFLFAQDFIVLSRFEVCNVTLERKLIFFFNNKEITITSYGSTNELKETMPEYFTINSANCGQEKIWSFEKRNDFYKTLMNGNGSTEIQKWFNDFDQISETVVFLHR